MLIRLWDSVRFGGALFAEYGLIYLHCIVAIADLYRWWIDKSVVLAPILALPASLAFGYVYNIYDLQRDADGG